MRTILMTFLLATLALAGCLDSGGQGTDSETAEGEQAWWMQDAANRTEKPEKRWEPVWTFIGESGDVEVTEDAIVKMEQGSTVDFTWDVSDLQDYEYPTDFIDYTLDYEFSPEPLDEGSAEDLPGSESMTMHRVAFHNFTLNYQDGQGLNKTQQIIIQIGEPCEEDDTQWGCPMYGVVEEVEEEVEEETGGAGGILATVEDAVDDGAPFTELLSLSAYTSETMLEADLELDMLYPTNAALTPVSYSLIINDKITLDSFGRYPGLDSNPMTWNGGAYMPAGTSEWAGNHVLFHVSLEFLTASGVKAPYEVQASANHGGLAVTSPVDFVPDDGAMEIFDYSVGTVYTVEDAVDDGAPFTELLSLSAYTSETMLEADLELDMLYPTNAALTPVSYSLIINDKITLDSFGRYPGLDSNPMTWNGGAYMPAGTSEWAGNHVLFHVSLEFLTASGVKAPYEVQASANHGGLAVTSPVDFVPDDGSMTLA